MSPVTPWPGVYVQEVPAASQPIAGVGTSVAAFVGLAPGGPVNEPVLIPNWTKFVNTFGGTVEPKSPYMAGAYLAHAVFGYFQNGGGICWVVRVGGSKDPPAPQAALPSAADPTIEAFRVVALDPAQGKTTVVLEEEPTPASEPPTEGGGSSEQPQSEPSYKLTVTSEGTEPEAHTGLSLKRGRGFIANRVNGTSKLIKIEEPGGQLTGPEGVPVPGKYELEPPSIPAGAIESGDIAGEGATRTGMGALEAIDEITMVCVPDVMLLSDDKEKKGLQDKMITHCGTLKDRMAILDPPPGLDIPGVQAWGDAYSSEFATLYYPWLRVMDPVTKGEIAVPPCGHMAGIWARTDATRGVHKAPANEVVQAALDVDIQITKEEQGILTPALRVNCIRKFPGRGIRVWGARTLSGKPEWQYLNVRRLFNYISESIMEGTQWAVFEPNDERLWMQLRIAASNFLTRTWRDGALFGATPAEAFFVKCDAETNPPEIVEIGQVIVEIGIAPVKPAEFVIFQISQQAGMAQASA